VTTNSGDFECKGDCSEEREREGESENLYLQLSRHIGLARTGRYSCSRASGSVTLARSPMAISPTIPFGGGVFNTPPVDVITSSSGWSFGLGLDRSATHLRSLPRSNPESG